MNYEFSTMVDVRLADSMTGFCFKELELEPLMNWRYNKEYLYADDRDAKFSFIVFGQSAGLLLFCGPDTGIFEYGLDGMPFQQVNLFDDWCLQAYRPVIVMFPSHGQHGDRQITVRPTGMRDERSKGTGIRIMKILGSR